MNAVLYEWGDMRNEVPFYEVEAMDVVLDINVMWQFFPDLIWLRGSPGRMNLYLKEAATVTPQGQGRDAFSSSSYKCKHYKMGDTAIAGMVSMHDGQLPPRG